MRWLPVDDSFGPPVAVLANSNTVLFENGTIAELSPQNKLDANSKGTMKYSFYYTNVDQLISLRLKKENISGHISTLLGKKTRSSITLFLFISMIFSFYLSINITEVFLIDSLSDKWQVVVGIFIAFIIIGFEFFIRDIFSQNRTKSLQLEILTKTRETPDFIEVDPRTTLDQLFDYHNAAIRLAIVLSIYSTTNGVGDFSTEMDDFLYLIFSLNIILYAFVLVLSPLLLLSVLNSYRKKHVRSKEVHIDEFYRLSSERVDAYKKEMRLNESKSIPELIAGDETSTLEFKGSIWSTYNPKNYELIKEKSDKNYSLQDAIVKTIAAFLNTDGGILLIGVKDKPHLRDNPYIGIENDYKFTKKKDKEGFDHALLDVLHHAFERKETIVKTNLNISYPMVQDKQLCMIEVQPLPRISGGAIWTTTKTMGPEEFFYRVSDKTNHASPKSASDYISQTFIRKQIDDEYEKSLS